MKPYKVKKYSRKYAEVSIPASKSALNRALILAALSKGDVRLICGSLSEDTRALLDCIIALGIDAEQTSDGFLIHGCGGDIPKKSAHLDVHSAGTAARFLPTALAFCGGNFTFTASEQMKKRPMEILSLLENAGIKIEYWEEEGRFPFRLKSSGIKTKTFVVNTDNSTQYASALLMAASIVQSPVEIQLEGSRTNGSYIQMTLDMMADFVVAHDRKENLITVYPQTAPPSVYEVEPDFSAACYFCALALLCRTKFLIKRIKLNTIQGDLQFLRLLQQRGLLLKETTSGLLADGSAVTSFEGFDEDFKDFSDQTLTAAALAPFASSPTHLRNISHIKLQECDRIHAIIKNLTSLGVQATTDGNDIHIEPAPVQPATIETFGDHRVAMAFTLVGSKSGEITIDDSDCSKKTFENYFEILDNLTK